MAIEVAGNNVQFLDAQLPDPIYVSTFNAVLTGTDISVVLARYSPLPTQLAQAKEGNAVLRIVGLLAMSPQAAKDLSILLTETVAKYEEEFGLLSTAFTKSRTKSN